jgi:hypothetical protein
MKGITIGRRPLALGILAFVALGSSVGAQGVAATGRIGGRVLEASSGAPIANARIVVRAVGGDSLAAVSSDLDGRFRTGVLPVGSYQVAVRRLGMQAKQYDSIAVQEGQTTLVNFALQSAVLSLDAVVISAERTDRATSEAGLLAVQQKAAAASDGVSAEQIARTPDSDAGEAAKRVSGVSIVDNKFVVVRGLSERYSNTLLNGVEVASPEPTKKVVPLDVFPASLLDAIVVTKTATPDRPGDFAGGSVEIRTKEFPEEFVLQYNVAVASNSQVTGRRVDLPVWRGMDFLGFDDGSRRQPPPLPRGVTDPTAIEAFSEALRNEWAPPTRTALPNISAGFSVGNQLQSESNALGYVAAVTYSTKNEFQPDRLFQFLLDPTSTPQRGFVYRERKASVDWGAVGNASLRLGINHKIGLRNLYTRNAEEQYTTSEGFNADLNGDFRGFQYSYITRDLFQTQLVGDHLLNLLRPLRVEWKGTLSRSGRDEPDNRQVPYVRPQDDTAFFVGVNSDLWFRYLEDKSAAGQVDASLSLPWFSGNDFTFKVGASLRRKVREFDASLGTLSLNQQASLPGRFGTLPPHLLFQPENVGNYLTINFPGAVAQPYSADDDLTSTYAMLDVPLLSWFRLVGGVRIEDWRLDLYDGGRELFAADSTLVPTARRNRDLLWSANATVALSSRMNIRIAGFRSVARPDTRELSRDEYVDAVGACPTIGFPSLQRTLITNADLRWEWYPGPGEIFSVSGFYKFFEKPIIRAVTPDVQCRFTFNNGTEAQNIGAEIDLRKSLLFLPGRLSNLAVGINGAYVKSKLKIDPSFGTYPSDLALEDQSPWLVNTTIGYVGRSVQATVLYNWFDDRISRYGLRSPGGSDILQGPNIVEKSRGTLDAKLESRLRGGWTATLSGKNLTNSRIELYQQSSQGRLQTGLARPGVTLSIGMSHAR